MASSLPFQSNSYRQGGRGYPSGYLPFQQKHFGNIYAETFSMPAYRHSSSVGASPKPPSSSNMLGGDVPIPETGFDTHCMGHQGISNGFQDFSAGSNLLPVTTPSVILEDHEQMDNETTACMSLHAARYISPLTFDAHTYSTATKPLNTDLRGLVGLEGIDILSQASQMPVDDTFELNRAFSWPAGLLNRDGYLVNMHSFNDGTFDLPSAMREPAMFLTTGMQGQQSHTNSDMNIRLHDMYSPFQIGNLWDEGLQQDIEDIPISTFQTNELIDYKFLHSHETAMPEIEILPNKYDRNKSSCLLEEPTKTSELLSIMPRPPLLHFDGISGVQTVEISSKLSRRRRLNKEEKRATARIRQVGSCKRCIFKKIKCTEGEVCKSCLELYLKNSLEQAPTCPRGKMSQHKNIYFPTIVFAHLDRLDMGRLLRGVQFDKRDMLVQLSLGSSYPSIPLVVSAFHTADGKFSYVPDLASNLNDEKQTFATVATSSFGVRPSDIEQLEKTCRNYMEMIDSQEETRFCSSRITRRVLDAARRFQKMSLFKNQDNLLRNAIKIAQLYLLMGKRFIFRNESSPSTLPSESSRLLDRQIKSIFYTQLVTLIPNMLDELDERLSNPKKWPWAISLLTQLLLCTCVEQLQVTIDAYIFSSIDTARSDHALVREHGRESCRKLEQMTLQHSWLLLEGILEGVQKKYNPFRIDFETSNDDIVLVFNEAEQNVVRDIREIMSDHYEEIVKRDKDNYYGCQSLLTADYKMFKERNISRHVCKLLRILC